MGLERVLGHIPARWENKPIAELSALRREKRDTQALGADLIVRALAILLVVVHHATLWPIPAGAAAMVMLIGRSEEHMSELQSLMRISYAVFCLKKKNQHNTITSPHRLNIHIQHR